MKFEAEKSSPLTQGPFAPRAMPEAKKPDGLSRLIDPITFQPMSARPA